MVTDLIVLDEIISRLPLEALSLKVVVFDDNDFLFAKRIHKRYPTAEFFYLLAITIQMKQVIFIQDY